MDILLFNIAMRIFQKFEGKNFQDCKNVFQYIDIIFFLSFESFAAKFSCVFMRMSFIWQHRIAAYFTVRLFTIKLTPTHKEQTEYAFSTRNKKEKNSYRDSSIDDCECVYAASFSTRHDSLEIRPPFGVIFVMNIRLFDETVLPLLIFNFIFKNIKSLCFNRKLDCFSVQTY